MIKCTKCSLEIWKRQFLQMDPHSYTIYTTPPIPTKTPHTSNTCAKCSLDFFQNCPAFLLEQTSSPCPMPLHTKLHDKVVIWIHRRCHHRSQKQSFQVGERSGVELGGQPKTCFEESLKISINFHNLIKLERFFRCFLRVETTEASVG